MNAGTLLSTVPAVEALLRRELVSFVRYVVEVSHPPVIDAVDERALAGIQDLYRESERGVRALRDLLGEHGVRVENRHWPLRFTSFNYLRPAFLLRPLIHETERHLEGLEAAAKSVDGSEWPAARRAVEDLIDAERTELERLRVLEKELRREGPHRSPIKGTSAARW